ncbi:MAG TPA: glycerophosphodiester phosphodiesterase [Cytophagales bacterium]|nr:glycerophosphodiester phosphodiesterase [Cytophagales bacterium]
MSCRPKKTIDVQGHRGCRGLFPENSLAAFEKAIDLGVNTLELDVVLSKDKKVVVSHEPFMSSLICLHPSGNEIESTGEQINLFELEYDSIRRYDCGLKDHPGYTEQIKIASYKPLLSEVFELVATKKSEVSFNIEIKSYPELYGIYTPYPPEYVKIVLELIDHYGMLSRSSLQSFDLNILEEVKRQYPQVSTALLVDANENIDHKLKALSFVPDIISPDYALLNKEIVLDYQKDGYRIIPWTVNNSSDLKKVLSWNVDGIITDYPNLLLQLLAD